MWEQDSRSWDVWNTIKCWTLLLKILDKTLPNLRLSKKDSNWETIEKCELNGLFLEIESTNSLNLDALARVCAEVFKTHVLLMFNFMDHVCYAHTTCNDTIEVKNETTSKKHCKNTRF